MMIKKRIYNDVSDDTFHDDNNNTNISNGTTNINNIRNRS
jgi:hypothetical protein